MPTKVPASPPVRVEIRLAGRIRFSDVVYGPQLERDEDSGVVTFTASLTPELVDAPAPAGPKPVFGTDPRDGEAVILQAHSGRRDQPTRPTPTAARSRRAAAKVE